MMYKVHPYSCNRDREMHGFTLLEILVVLVVIGILAALVITASSMLRARAQRIQCTANLRSLYVAANLYVQQNGGWPQIAVEDSDSAEEDYAIAWVAALKPFGVSEKNWICPTVQELLRTDYSQPENARADYAATPFDDKPMTPLQWPRQPWFIETGNVHGNGNLIIFTDGSANDLNTVVAHPSSATSP